MVATTTPTTTADGTMVTAASSRKAGLGAGFTPSLGSGVLIAVALGNVGMWLAARPANQPTARYLGELCGAEAVLLFAGSLVLATLLHPIEWAFGGLDRVVVWHRRAAIAGLVLLVPHLALVTTSVDPYATSLGQGLGVVALLGLLLLGVWALAPRLRAARWPGPIQQLARTTFERWLTAHRLTGLFVAVAVAHGAIVDPVLRASAVLRVTYLAIGGIGIAAYVYREVFARFVVPIHDYTVATVRRPTDTTLEVALEPAGAPLSFIPGQFVVLAFGGASAWQRHPFSVASAPSERRLEVAVKAVGDYTRDLREKLQPGTPAKAVGPFGGFDYRHGGEHQIWIAGGIGITPFMSWIRALNGTLDRGVAFYYSIAKESDALYLDEIDAAAARYATFRPHIIVAERDGLLTAGRTLNETASPTNAWVYMCGPPPMMTALADGFRLVGIPANHIRWEDFSLR
jgi:predicted ferric reductase